MSNQGYMALLKKVRKAGARGDSVALCPFHKEKTPSFRITPRKGMYYCFGCQKGGRLVKLEGEIREVLAGQATDQRYRAWQRAQVMDIELDCTDFEPSEHDIQSLIPDNNPDLPF